MIVLSSSSYLVVLKPRGMLSVPKDLDPSQPSVTGLVGAVHLRHRGEALLAATRLDRAVGGLMVLARGVAAKEAFREALRGGKVRRLYLALTSGPLPDGQANVLMGKYAHKTVWGPRASALPFRCETSTAVRRLGRLGPWWLHSFELLTGFRHQIRALAASFKSRLVGDALYFPAAFKLSSRPLRSLELELFSSRGAIALECIGLAFPAPSASGADEEARV